MFGLQAGYGAGAQYRRLDVVTKVEGASPHALIGILFDELLVSLEAVAAAVRSGDIARRGQRQTRALSILHALEASLDHEQGGEIASGLQSIYRETRRLSVEGVRTGDPEHVLRARAVIAEIADAWTSIG